MRPLFYLRSFEYEGFLNIYLTMYSCFYTLFGKDSGVFMCKD